MWHWKFLAVNILIYPEEVVHICFVKIVFFKILETSTCAGVFFNKVADLRPPSYDSLKKDASAGIFRWILQNFSEHVLRRTPANDCIYTLAKFSWLLTFLLWRHKRFQYLNKKNMYWETCPYWITTPCFLLHVLSYLVSCMYLLASVDLYLFL